MRYSIAFLGLVAFTSTGTIASPVSTTTTTTDPCKKGIQPLIALLASDPKAAKFCAAKYPPASGGGGTVIVKPSVEVRSDNPLYVQLVKSADKIAKTFCECNFSAPPQRGRAVYAHIEGPH
ncbi:hypothetical protein T440DRAFT_506451 [Plenodomus tracheiphilus IPT5]|uniref:Uncharacterized protein n=1 Tax=Plenodomus tracheiphilus IPT5 TaxID=1408161 RepID=A0A6A7BAJ2_9PLEO|nr:hypothetical protein T440DRAFT_506451 [Plenodomus tracheiphilus IPT5]